MSDEWRPGDPVHEPEPTYHGSCGPCLVRWTAKADNCPECGQLSTEALRRELGGAPAATWPILEPKWSDYAVRPE